MSASARVLGAAPAGDAEAVAGQPVGVVDIGSNTVRLVVYDGASRAPVTMFNESAFCGLGRDLENTGHLAPAAMGQALRAITRFSGLARGMGVRQLSLIATAAVRDARNGADFAGHVKRLCGEPVTILTGEDEARLSALGVIGAIPDADGIVGDLGGGSLELVEVRHGAPHRHATLPLGILRLGALHATCRADARSRIERGISEIDWLRQGTGRTLYPVGGAWRALARLHMAHVAHPLHMIDGYAMSAADMGAVTDLVAGQSQRALQRMSGIAGRRRDSLALAGELMGAVLAASAADRVVFSAQGLREGFLFARLGASQRASDPVLVAAAALAAREARFGLGGAMLFDWIAPLFGGRREGGRRLRLIACHLADVGWREHPDYRAIQTFNRLLRFPFVGLGHEARAGLALSVFVRYGGDPAAPEIRQVCRLMSERARRRGEIVGRALRLAFSVSGGGNVLARTRLRVEDDRLHLDLPGDGSAPGAEALERPLGALAVASGLVRGGIDRRSRRS